MKDRNLVLTAGRKLKGKIKISEEFTEKDREARKNLAGYALKNSKQPSESYKLSNYRVYLIEFDTFRAMYKTQRLSRWKRMC